MPIIQKNVPFFFKEKKKTALLIWMEKKELQVFLYLFHFLQHSFYFVDHILFIKISYCNREKSMYVCMYFRIIFINWSMHFRSEPHSYREKIARDTLSMVSRVGTQLGAQYSFFHCLPLLSSP